MRARDQVLLDCEFRDFGSGCAHYPDFNPVLISVGLVAGAERLYIELDGVREEQCSESAGKAPSRRSAPSARKLIATYLAAFGRKFFVVTDSPRPDVDPLAALLDRDWPACVPKIPYQFCFDVAVLGEAAHEAALSAAGPRA
jgi:hypothetical protein